MEIFLFVVAVVAALIYFSMKRGKKAVQAYIYLASIKEGSSEDDANAMASRVDFFRASKFNEAMRLNVRVTYGGSQLSMISDARLAGFRG